MNRFNKKYKIIYELILIIIFAFLSFCFCGRTVNAEGGQNADAGQAVPNPYVFNYFADIYKDGQFIINGEVSCEVQVSGRLIISGDRQSFNAASFGIEKLYDFGTGYPNRVRLDIQTDISQDTYVELYKDGSDEPFARKKLYPQNNNKNNSLKSVGLIPVFIEIEEGAIGAEEKIYLKFDDTSEDSDTESKVILNSIKFYKESVPTINLEIDESLGTIARMNESPDHSVCCYGNVNIKVPEGYSSEYMSKGKKYTGGTYKLEYIRGRGNSTWKAKTLKKPYKIKLEDSVDLFGMGKGKEYALIANYYDNTLIKNRITYYLGNALDMEYSPCLVPVDLVMNGEYLGSYYLSETIEVGKNRVNINDLEKIKSEDEDISGGYLLGLSPYKNSDKHVFLSNYGISFEVQSPKKIKDENISPAKLDEMNAYIEDYINKTESAIFGEDFKDENGVSYTEYMDIESAAKFAIVQEFAANRDAYNTSSTYLYKVQGGKLYWGPLWDFDYVAWNGEFNNPNTDGSKGFFITTLPWFERLRNDPEFMQELIDVWGDIDTPGTLHYQVNELIKEGGIIDQYEAELKNAAENNFDKPGVSKHVVGVKLSSEELEASVSDDYHSEIVNLKNWIRTRMENFDKYIQYWRGHEYNLRFYDGEELVSEKVNTRGLYIGDLPQVSREGYIFGGWYYYKADQVNEANKIYITPYQKLPYTRDMSFYAEWIEADKYAVPEGIYFLASDYYIKENATLKLDATVVPEKAGNIPVEYSVDSLGLCTLSSTGELKSNKVPGVVTVTASTYNGFTATCRVHILDSSYTLQEYEIGVSEDSVELKAGEYKKLDITYQPEGAINKGIYISNLGRNIAYMTSAGVIFAVSPGEAEINVTSKDGKNKLTIYVTVTASEEEKGGGNENEDQDEKNKDKKQDDDPKPETPSENGKASDNDEDSGHDEAREYPHSEWISGLWYNEDGTQTYTPKGSWKVNGTGWWYEDTSGWYPVSTWQKIDSMWYYFDEEGYMAASEWRQGYWLSANGALEYDGKATWNVNSTGWWYEDTLGWYAKDQWVKINGFWYYFGKEGYMVTNQVIEGYHIGSDGRIISDN